MSSCPNCGKYVQPNILGKKVVKCKKCFSLLVESEKHAETARLGFLIIVLIYPAAIFTLSSYNVNMVYLIIAPLSIIYLNWATKYKIHKINEEHEKNKVLPPYK